MKFICDFVGISLDIEAYREKVLKELRWENGTAGRKWLNEVIKGTPIPTWSGASRATFEKLATALGTSVPIGHIRAPADRTALGRSLSDGEVIEDKGEVYVGFRYSTNLLHLHYNEYNKATAGRYPRPYSNNVRFTPYKFQARAQKVWVEHAKKVRLPNPLEYIKERRL